MMWIGCDVWFLICVRVRFGLGLLLDRLKVRLVLLVNLGVFVDKGCYVCCLVYVVDENEKRK